ncbi:MAG: hypothetical protein N4A39_06040 [Roseicyclus sp.]|nr:hypothetical protein [Roseicyclus sp.]
MTRAAALLVAALAASVSASVSAPVAAQLAGGAEAMDEVLAPTGAAAPLLRCAGLYRAFRLLAGEATEVGAEALEGEVALAFAAAARRESDTGASPAAAMDQIAPVIAAVGQLYLDRMGAARAATGSVMDDGLEATLFACAELRAVLAGAKGG